MMYILANSKEISKEWVAEVAQQSAKYLLGVFKEDGANICSVVCSLARFCIERKEVATYLNIMRYLKEMNHALPEHYNELASNNDAFDFYCRLLLYYLVEYSAQQSAQ